MRGPAASDNLLSRVAAYYNEAVTAGSKAPVKYAEDRLRAAGAPVSARGGRVQVEQPRAEWTEKAEPSRHAARPMVPARPIETPKPVAAPDLPPRSQED